MLSGFDATRSPMSKLLVALVLVVSQHQDDAFQLVPMHNGVDRRRHELRAAPQQQQVVSPFESLAADNIRLDDEEDDELDPDVELPLTLENVEKVLDELRPYLMSDGGNVRVAAIDGPVVRLELEGACGTCPSSTMTMKMGLERRLKEVIPEISEVVQALPDAPELTIDGVNEVLDGVRPFLSVAGGQVDIVDLSGVNSLQPLLQLSISGKSASLHSVRQEISQRIQRFFMTPGLRIEWDD